MVIFRNGRKIKSIEEVVDGETYTFGGLFGGVLTIVLNDMGVKVYRFFCKKDGTYMFLTEESLKEKIQYGLVRKGATPNIVKEDTLKKIFKK